MIYVRQFLKFSQVLPVPTGWQARVHHRSITVRYFHSWLLVGEILALKVKLVRCDHASAVDAIGQNSWMARHNTGRVICLTHVLINSCAGVEPHVSEDSDHVIPWRGVVPIVSEDECLSCRKRFCTWGQQVICKWEHINTHIIVRKISIGFSVSLEC